MEVHRKMISVLRGNRGEAILLSSTKVNLEILGRLTVEVARNRHASVCLEQ